MNGRQIAILLTSLLAIFLPVVISIAVFGMERKVESTPETVWVIVGGMLISFSLMMIPAYLMRSSRLAAISEMAALLKDLQEDQDQPTKASRKVFSFRKQRQ